MMNWTRKTEAGQFKPYISENNRFEVIDLSMNKMAIPAFGERYGAALRDGFKGEAMKDYERYCQQTGLTHKKACWVLTDWLAGEQYYPFKTAKEAKAFAETL